MNEAQTRALIPADWAEGVGRLSPDGGPSGADWLRSLPRLLSSALERWELVVDGPAMTGWTALVLPVLRDGEQLALKVVWPHPEAQHEAVALRYWAGQGAVRLVAANPADGQLLLERLDNTRDLQDPAMEAEDACAVMGALLARLHVPAPPMLVRLEDFLAPHFSRMLREPRVPHRVAQRTTGLARELFASAGEPVLLHTDLHFANVLAGGREPWLAIDPKPLAGPAGFEIQPALRNRMAEMGTGASLRWCVRRRVEVMAEAMGIDLDEARAWSMVHSGLQVHWARDSPEDASQQLALMKALDT